MSTASPTTYTTLRRVKSRKWVNTGRGPMMEEQPTITAGEARAALDHVATDRPDLVSTVNPGLTRAQAAGILRKALPDDDDAPIFPLIARNVLRLVLHRKRLPKVTP